MAPVGPPARGIRESKAVLMRHCRVEPATLLVRPANGPEGEG